MCLEANEQNVPTEANNETENVQSNVTSDQTTDNAEASDGEEDCGCDNITLNSGTEFTKELAKVLDDKVEALLHRMGNDIETSQDLIEVVGAVFSRDELEALAVNRINDIHAEILQSAKQEPSMGEILAHVFGQRV